jgi:hypothetical protein
MTAAGRALPMAPFTGAPRGEILRPCRARDLRAPDRRRPRTRPRPPQGAAAGPGMIEARRRGGVRGASRMTPASRRRCGHSRAATPDARRSSSSERALRTGGDACTRGRQQRTGPSASRRGDCSDSSIPAASGRWNQCAKTAPLLRSRSLTLRSCSSGAGVCPDSRLSPASSAEREPVAPTTCAPPSTGSITLRSRRRFARLCGGRLGPTHRSRQSVLAGPERLGGGAFPGRILVSDHRDHRGERDQRP